MGPGGETVSGIREGKKELHPPFGKEANNNVLTQNQEKGEKRGSFKIQGKE